MNSTATAARLCPDLYAAPARRTPVLPPPLTGPPAANVFRAIAEEERERLMLLHLPQVRLIAESLRERLRFSMELDDLMGYGMVGLLKAIERFDASRGVLLKTYAEHRIRGAMLDGLSATDWVPRSARQKERLYRESEWQSHACSQLPSPAAGLACSPKPCTQKPAALLAEHPRAPLMELIYVGADLGEFEKQSEKAGLRGLLGAEGEDPETQYQREEMRARLAAAVSRLPRRHARVIELYYHRELSMKRIAEMLSVHESRVSQLHAAALRRLRSFLAPLSARGGPRASTSRAGRTRQASRAQRPPCRRLKYRVTASRSSSVSTPMVSAAVSAT